MIIAIEATLAASDCRTGLGQYVLHLLHALHELRTGHQFLLLHAGRDWRGPDFGPAFRPVSYHLGKQSLAIAFQLGRVLKRERADLFHATGTTGVPPVCPCPAVATVHDLYPLLHPEHCRRAHALFFRLLWRWTVRNSQQFLTNSEFIANELANYAGIDPQRINTVPLAPCGPPPAASDRPGTTTPDRPILCVGALEPRKGQTILVRAYLAARAAGASLPPLILVGPDRGSRAEIVALLATAGEAARPVQLLSFVPQAEIARLYASAALFVFPSLYEGFGLPILEAMRHRLPILCSDIPVLREIGGNLPTYVKAANPDAWRNALVAAFANGPPSPPAADRLDHHLARFSWRQCAEQTLACYESVARPAPLFPDELSSNASVKGGEAVLEPAVPCRNWLVDAFTAEDCRLRLCPGWPTPHL